MESSTRVHSSLIDMMTVSYHTPIWSTGAATVSESATIQWILKKYPNFASLVNLKTPSLKDRP